MAPFIETVPVTNLPNSMPEGFTGISLKGTDDFGNPPETQVIRWADHSYWMFEFADNRATAVVAYNWSGKLVKKWNMRNIRYIWDVKLNLAEQTVTFWGQGNEQETLELKELCLSIHQDEGLTKGIC